MAPRSTAALVWLIVSQLGYAASLVPWLAMAGLSVMAFDAPGSTEQTAAWVFVGVIWSYPLLPLVCGIAAWLFYAKRRTRAAVVATTLPIVVVGGLILTLWAIG